MRHNQKRKSLEFIEDHQHNQGIKYFFIGICSIEIVFLFWRFIFGSTRNGGAFLSTFFIVLAISFPLGLGVVINIFRNKDSSFLFTFGLCVGYGLMAGIWAIMLRIGCPLNPYLYIGAVLMIAACLLCIRWKDLRTLFTKTSSRFTLTNLLSPLAVLLFAFILLSMTWINNYVPNDVDCQSDSYNALMILKEGAYPVVNPFLDDTRLQLNSGHLLQTVIAVITKLKNSILLKEIMAITIISGAFFCMGIYFLAKFVIENEIVLFFAGILTLTRSYLSLFNDGNLPENIAYYCAVLFIVFLMYVMENKKWVFALLAGFCLFLCLLSHPIIFMYNIPVFVLFFATFLISKHKNLRKDYVHLLIVMGVILAWAFPFILRLKEAEPELKLYSDYATTFKDSLPYWHGYAVLILSICGMIILAARRKAVNVYLWTYFLMHLIFVEYWRFYQIVSPSWFELVKLDAPAFGAYYSYNDFLKYPMNYQSAWFGGLIIWPVSIAVVFNLLHEQCVKYINAQIVKKYAVLFFAAMAFFFFAYEFKNARRYPEFILKSDYASLEWLRNNTLYKNTLIYSPFDNSKDNAIPDYLSSFWVPAVSERKSIPFRNFSEAVQFKFINIDNPITEKVNQLQKAAFSISDSESYNIFKDMKITHIFVSGFLSEKLYNIFQSSTFVELIHYDTIPDQGTALIYRVK